MYRKMTDVITLAGLLQTYPEQEIVKIVLKEEKRKQYCRKYWNANRQRLNKHVSEYSRNQRRNRREARESTSV